MLAIYSINNTSTNQSYVGSTINFHRRISTHLRILRRNCHHSPYLQNSFNKYGEQSFVFSVLEILDDPNKLISKEQYWIDTLQPEFNVLKVANSHLGARRTREVCEKISRALTGKKLSNETKQKIRICNLGKRHTLETRNKISESNKGKHNVSKELRLLLSALNKNKIISEQHKDQIRRKLSRPVNQFTKDGQHIASFVSIKEAARITKTNEGHISQVAKGKRKTANKFIWRYQDG